MNLHKYAVVLKNYHDLENFYNDMETEGGSITIPNRAVDVYLRKPKSRVTHYMLTPQEALAVEQDTRVEFVELVTDELPVLMHTRSGRWARSSSNNASDNQWGLWRHYIGENNANFDSNLDVITQDIRFPYTGKNVDVIILDDQAWEPNHSEFLDDNGVSRVVDYNWWQHASAVGDSSHVGRTYAQRGTSSNFHNIHCAGTAVGRQEGWAKDANIYFLAIRFGGNDVNNSIDPTLAYDYIREFHNNKPINPLTGRKNPTIVNNSWGFNRGTATTATLSTIQSVTYDGTTYTTPGLIGFVYNGFYGAYSATSQIVDKSGDPTNNKNRFTTSGTASSVTDRMVAWPETWEKMPNQVFSFTQTDPADEYEVTVLAPCDVSQNSRIRASCNSANSYIILRRIVDNGSMISTQVNGPEIDVEITGGFGFSSSRQVSIRYIVETYPEDSDEIGFDVSWVVTTGERGQFFSDFDETLEMQEFNEETVSPAPDQSGTVQVLPFAAIPSVSGLTVSSTPNNGGTNTRGFWTLNLPFSIQYLGQTYSQIRVSTDSFIALGSGMTTAPSRTYPVTPAVPKIMIGAGAAYSGGGWDNRRCYSIWYGTTGVTPNREFRIVWEGSENTTSSSNNPANPTMRWEVRFFENAPNTFDVTWEQNEGKNLIYDLFSSEELRAFGYNSGGQHTAQVPSVEADIIDAISDGIIVVASAGNGYVPMYSSDHPYYNNYYTTTSNINVYYHRPQTPAGAGNSTDSAVIVVGALNLTHRDNKERKADFSNFGQNVDIFAAGNFIQSAMPDISSRTKVDRGGGNFYSKVSGTSMSCPQVCGILACMLEKYPDMTQKQARELLNVISKPMQMSDDPAETYNFNTSLEGAANKVLWFPNMRPNNKPSFPKIYKGRPASGSVYPRRQIRRRKIL
jgi:hypothetical protein